VETRCLRNGPRVARCLGCNVFRLASPVFHSRGPSLRQRFATLPPRRGKGPRDAQRLAVGPRDPLENSGVRRPVGARDPRLPPGNGRRSPGRAGLLDAVDARTHCAHRSLCRRELPPSVHCGALLDSCNPALPGDRLRLPGVSRGSRAPTGRRTPEFSRGSRGPMAIQGVNLPLKSNCPPRCRRSRSTSSACAPGALLRPFSTSSRRRAGERDARSRALTSPSRSGDLLR
jgi:hypothetical protein